jgi:hypothetical protein
MKKNITLFLFSLILGLSAIYSFQYGFESENEENEMSPDQKKYLAGEYFKLRAKQRAGIDGKEDVAGFYNAIASADLLHKQNGSRAAGIEWEELGPDDVGGRTRCLLIDPKNPQMMWTGSVSGGLYYSDNGGGDWKRYDANNALLNIMTISCMSMSKDGDIYVGTGNSSENASGSEGSGFGGNGILKKKAGETTFSILASTYTANPSALNTVLFNEVNDIDVDRNNNDIVYAATSKGLKISKDGGATWAAAAAPMNTGGIECVKVDKNNNVLVSVRSGSAYKSSDNGSTWVNMLANNATFNSSNRHELIVSESDPNYIYLLAIKTSTPSGSLKHIIQSQDGGLSWKQIGFGDAISQLSFDPFCQTVGTAVACQGWYDIAFGVHPTDKEKLYLGGAARFYTWSPATGWLQASSGGDFKGALNYIHADMHNITFHPTNPNIMFITCDGGVFKSENAISKFPYPTFTPKNRNYNATQLYSVAASPIGEVLGGAQDNGTNFLNFKMNSAKSSKEVSGGDGFDCEISHINPNYHFYSVYSGSLSRSANRGDSKASLATSAVDGVDGTAGNGDIDGVPFFTRMHLMENKALNQSILFIPSQWNGTLFMLSNAISQNALRWHSSVKIGGEGFGMASSKDSKVLYVGRLGGISKLTGFENFKDTIDPVTNVLSIIPGKDITVVDYNHPASNVDVLGIGVDPNNNNNIVTASGGFGGTKIYMSLNGGQTFSSRQGNLPIMPSYDAMFVGNSSKIVIVATELGMWMTDDITVAAPVWYEVNDKLGRVPVFKIRQENLYVDGCPVIYLGTHGRGFFRSTSYTPDGCHKAFTYGADITKNNPANHFSITPNMVENTTKVEFVNTYNGAVFITILNTNGQVVKRIKEATERGNNSIEVDLSYLSKGSYILRIESDKSVIGGGKFIKN